jgi:hypothetical protein
MRMAVHPGEKPSAQIKANQNVRKWSFNKF